jgi:hypothetical protein
MKPILILLALLSFEYVHSELLVKPDYNLEWGGINEEKINANNSIKYITLKNGVYSFPNPLPTYSILNKLSSNVSITNVNLINVTVEKLTANEIQLIQNENISNTFEVSFDIKTERKSNYISVIINPIRKKGNSYEKIVSFNIDYEFSKNNFNKTAALNYSSNSVLASGKWLKVGVVKDGIYKIDFNFLKKNGIDVSSFQLFCDFPPKQIANFMSECLVLGVYDEQNEVVLLHPDHPISNGLKIG